MLCLLRSVLIDVFAEGEGALFTALLTHLKKFYDDQKARAIVTAFRANYAELISQLSLADVEVLAGQFLSGKHSAGGSANGSGAVSS